MLHQNNIFLFSVSLLSKKSLKMPGIMFIDVLNLMSEINLTSTSQN